MILQSAVNNWAASFPKTVACLNKLHVNGVRLAVFSSRLAHLIAESNGVNPGFSPKDTDIILPKEDFELATKVLNQKPITKVLKVKTSDGLTLKMLVKEIVYKTDSDIQFIQPLSPLAGNGSTYYTAFTEAAANARQFYETEQGIVPLTHFADALYFYGILQRSNPHKDDKRNMALIKPVTPNDKYSKRRAAEMSIDNRVKSYIENAEVLAKAPAIR